MHAHKGRDTSCHPWLKPLTIFDTTNFRSLIHNFDTARFKLKMTADHESTFQKQVKKRLDKKSLASFFLISQNTWICDMSSSCFLLCSYTISPIFKNKQENNLYILLLKYLQKEKQKEKIQGLGLYRKKERHVYKTGGSDLYITPVNKIYCL